jgi:hypothetical protein
MRCPKLVVSTFLVALICAAPKSAVAGPFGDDMAKCLVKSTSPEDRTLLVRWIFSAIALHPDLTSLAAISTQQRDEITKKAGALFQRLLLESCKAETQQAVQNEGSLTIQYAFQILGQAATRGLFSDPHVAEGMKDLAKNIDEEKLKALISPKSP